MSPEEMKERQDERKFNLIVEFRILKQKMEDFTGATKEYREGLDKKFDKIFSWLENLPCKERKGKYANYDMQFKALWIIVGATLGTIVIKFFQR